MPPKTRTRRSEAILPGYINDLEKSQRQALAAERVLFLTLKEATEKATRWSFVDFAEKFLGLTLTPAQKAVAGFLFDGAKPDPRYVDVAFGGATEAAPESARRTALAICGRGSGKTRILIAARAIHLALIADVSPMAYSETALVALVAPTEKHGIHSLNFVKGFFAENKLLERILKVESTKLVVKLTRPDGRQVTIEVRPASAGGDSVRGPSLCGVLLDEAAFFYGEGYEVNDTEIWRAAIPRLLQDGQIVLGTTPWAQTGLVWELFRDNFGKPTSAVVCRAPTLVMRTDQLEKVTLDYQNLLAFDPDNAIREYDAQFLSADAERFFPEAVIEKCIDKTLIVPSPVAAGERCYFGGDFAFASDSSALVGFAERDKLEVVALLEQRPKPDCALVPSEVVHGFATEVKRCGARMVTADDHYRESIQEHLTAHGLALIPAPSPPAAGFVVARTLMAGGRVRIPNHPRLLAQLRRVKATIKPGGVITIHQPRAKEGGHGDIVSALVCALSGCSTDAVYPGPSPRNRLEAEAWAEKERQKERLKENETRLAKVGKRAIMSLRQQFGAKLWRNLTS